MRCSCGIQRVTPQAVTHCQGLQQVTQADLGVFHSVPLGMQLPNCIGLLSWEAHRVGAIFLHQVFALYNKLSQVKGLLSFLPVLEIPSGIQAMVLFPRLLEHQDLLIPHSCILYSIFYTGEFSSTHFLCLFFLRPTSYVPPPHSCHSVKHSWQIRNS